MTSAPTPSPTLEPPPISLSAVAINFFSGLGIIMILVALVYLMSLIWDKYACFNSSVDILTPHELEERRTASDLIRKAGIAGILADERIRIFRSFFDRRSYPYKKTEDDTGGAKTSTDIEAQDAPANETVKSNEDEAEGDDKSAGASAEDGSEKQDFDEDEDGEKPCAICLNEYDDGEKVLTGTKCEHMFHYECYMQWVEKGNNHCPYCREDMLKPDELLEAAKLELGDKRVDKLIRINQDAARRLATLQSDEIVNGSAANNAAADEESGVEGPPPAQVAAPRGPNASESDTDDNVRDEEMGSATSAEETPATVAALEGSDAEPDSVAADEEAPADAAAEEKPDSSHPSHATESVVVGSSEAGQTPSKTEDAEPEHELDVEAADVSSSDSKEEVSVADDEADDEDVETSAGADDVEKEQDAERVNIADDEADDEDVETGAGADDVEKEQEAERVDIADDEADDEDVETGAGADDVEKEQEAERVDIDSRDAEQAVPVEDEASTSDHPITPTGDVEPEVEEEVVAAETTESVDGDEAEASNTSSGDIEESIEKETPTDSADS